MAKCLCLEANICIWIRLPCKDTGQVVISSTQLSINIRKRGSWWTNGHRLGIVFYMEGASSYKKDSVALNSVYIPVFALSYLQILRVNLIQRLFQKYFKIILVIMGAVHRSYTLKLPVLLSSLYSALTYIILLYMFIVVWYVFSIEEKLIILSL